VKAVYAVGVLIAAIAVSLPAGTSTVDEPITVRRIDWVLLNARVDLLADAMSGRFSRSISPPIYRYEAPAHRIIALATVAEGTNVNRPNFRRRLADAARIFCLQPHMPESVLSPDPLPGISCTAEFYQIQGARGSIKVGTFEIAMPKR
jgi:hypothetical protein